MPKQQKINTNTTGKALGCYDEHRISACSPHGK